MSKCFRTAGIWVEKKWSKTNFQWFYIKDFSVICRFAPLLCTCLCPVHGGKAGSRYQGLQHLQVWEQSFCVNRPRGKYHIQPGGRLGSTDVDTVLFRSSSLVHAVCGSKNIWYSRSHPGKFHFRSFCWLYHTWENKKSAYFHLFA